MFSSVLVVTILVSLCSADNIVKDCGPSDAYIKFNKIDISPMPFNLLSNIRVNVDVETKTLIGDNVKLKVNVRKSNLNGGFTWELPCTNIGLIGPADKGFQGYLGTCDYPASCDFPFIKSWVSGGKCPSKFADYGIECKCPFPVKHINTSQKGGTIDVYLGEFKDIMPPWLIEGGYIAKAELFDTTKNDKLVGCVEVKFDAKYIPCEKVLADLNAC